MANRYPLSIHPMAGAGIIYIGSELGYHARFNGTTLDFTIDQRKLAEEVAEALNYAFEEGKETAQAEIREALGIKDPDDD